MDVPCRCRGLTLRVLRSLPSSLEPVLLAFLHSGIASQQTRLTQRKPVRLRIQLQQSPRNAVTDGTGFSGDASPLDLDHDVEAALPPGHPERHPHLRLVDRVAEVLLERSAVDHDLALTRQQPDAGDSRLATAGAGVESGDRHRLFGSWSVERFRLLCLMRMIRPGIDLQLAQLLGPETIVRKHPLDGATDDLLGSARQQVTERLLLEALGVAAVAAVQLGLELVAGHRDTAGVEHDHVITRIEIRLVGRLVLALEDTRDARGETAERLVRRVHDVPAPLDLALSDRIGLRVHRSSFTPFDRSDGRPIATRRRFNPLAGADVPSRAGPGAATAARTARSSILPWPPSRRHATIRGTIPRRKASARTAIVTILPSRLARTIVTVRTDVRPATPKARKSCRPMKTDPARSIAAVSSGVRTPSAVRSRSGLRGPFQTV